MQFDSFTKKTMHEVRCDIIENHLTTTMNYDEETLIELMKISDYFICKSLKHLYLEIFIKTKKISTLDKLRYLDTLDIYFFNQTLDFSLRNMFLMFFLRQSIVNSQEYEKLFGFLEIGKSENILMTHDRIVIGSLFWFFDLDKVFFQLTGISAICFQTLEQKKNAKRTFTIQTTKNPKFIDYKTDEAEFKSFAELEGTMHSSVNTYLKYEINTTLHRILFRIPRKGLEICPLIKDLFISVFAINFEQDSNDDSSEELIKVDRKNNVDNNEKIKEEQKQNDDNDDNDEKELKKIVKKQKTGNGDNQQKNNAKKLIESNDNNSKDIKTNDSKKRKTLVIENEDANIDASVFSDSEKYLSPRCVLLGGNLSFITNKMIFDSFEIKTELFSTNKNKIIFLFQQSEEIDWYDAKRNLITSGDLGKQYCIILSAEFFHYTANLFLTFFFIYVK
jgi:hypothetical protein